MKPKTDIPQNGWWNILPKRYHKWLRLGRFDRPIGSWLLLLPSLWTIPIFLNSVSQIIQIYLGNHKLYHIQLSKIQSPHKGIKDQY